jgi:hypothetical protein
MNYLEIHNQAEYDANKDFDGILIVKSGIIYASDNATVDAWGNATVRASDNATVRASGNATVEASDNATVRAWGNATVDASGNATVEASGNATVRASDNATVRASDNATVRASDNAYCLLLSGSAKFSGIMNATCKKYIDPVYDLSVLDFIAEHNGDDIVLYKSVNPETGCDFRTGKIKYELGSIVECPDWDPDPERQCGGGLHLSPTALGTQSFNVGKILKCLVKREDIVVYSKNIEKVRCRAARPVAVVDRAGRVIE